MPDLCLGLMKILAVQNLLLLLLLQLMICEVRNSGEVDGVKSSKRSAELGESARRSSEDGGVRRWVERYGV